MSFLTYQKGRNFLNDKTVPTVVLSNRCILFFFANSTDHTKCVPQIKAYFRLFAVHLHIVPSPQKKLFTDRHTIVAVLGGCPPEAKIMRDLRRQSCNIGWPTISSTKKIAPETKPYTLAAAAALLITLEAFHSALKLEK